MTLLFNWVFPNLDWGTLAESSLSNVPVLLTAILGSGLTTAFLNHSLKAKENVRSEKQKALYLAHQIAILFERYTLKVATDLASELHAKAEGDDFVINQGIASIPDFSELPDSAAYIFLDPKLRDSAYDFSDRIKIANHVLGNAFYYEGEGQLAKRSDKARATEAIKAWEVAKSFRSHYKIAARDEEIFNWEYINFLRKIAKDE